MRKTKENKENKEKNGFISKCLEQMIKVNMRPIEKTLKSSKTPIKTSLSDIMIMEKPREKAPLPQSPVFKIKEEEKLSDFEELKEKIKTLRLEEEKVLFNNKKKTKNRQELEYSLILEDFKYRVIQKAFFSFMRKRLILKKQKKKEFEDFKNKKNCLKMGFFFGIFRDFIEKKKEKHKFMSFLLENKRIRMKSMSFTKLKAYFSLKRSIREKGDFLIKNSMFFSIKTYLLKLRENCQLLRNYHEFQVSKEKKTKIRCFQAWKSNKIGLLSIKSRIQARKNEGIEGFSLRISIKKRIIKEIKVLVSMENRLLELVYRHKNMRKINISKGKFNLNEIKKLFIEKSHEFLIRKAFSGIKLAFLQRKKTILSSFYQEIKQKSRLFIILKRNRQENRDLCQLLSVFYGLRLKLAFFKLIKKKLLRKKARNETFYLAKSFNLLKKYSNYHKNKRNCLISISQAYSRKFQAKILHRWSSIIKSLQPINGLYRHSLKKRYFHKFLIIFTQRKLLKKYLIFLSLEYSIEKPQKTPFVLLKEILSKWKEQVFESENTKAQKIKNFMALNHRKNTLKFRVFSYWSLLLKRKSGLFKLISHFARIFNIGVFQKWRKHVALEEIKEITIEKSLGKFRLNVAFQKLKGWFLQRKIIRVFRLKRTFLGWRQGFLFRTKYWPFKLSQMNRKKQVFEVLKTNIALRRKKAEIIGFLMNFRRKKLFRALFKTIVIRINLRKKLEFSRLLKQYKLKKAVFKAILTRTYLRKLRSKQMRIAEKFRFEKLENRKKMRFFEETLEKEHVVFKVFSILKTNFLRKKAEEAIFQRFGLLRKRKIQRKYLEKWINGYFKGKKRKEANLYSIDLKKYQTPKFEYLKKNEEVLSKNESLLKESRYNLNNSKENSYGNWLKEYEENEKYMNRMLEDKL